MKILVVEDDSRKCEAILLVLKQNYQGCDIEVARSYQSGLRAAYAIAPDVLILDMSIPNYDTEPGTRSGKPRPLGGFEILRKLRRRRSNTLAVVLTQLDHFGDEGQEYNFQELEAKCRDEFPENFVGAIYYAQSSADWKDQLAQYLASIGSKK